VDTPSVFACRTCARRFSLHDVRLFVLGIQLPTEVSVPPDLAAPIQLDFDQFLSPGTLSTALPSEGPLRPELPGR
jgi:hypothetical protein